MRGTTEHRHSYAKSRQSFERETADHELTILRDDGVYRHLRCKAPGMSIYWFDVVTWPGHLYIGGDIDSYCFARIHDMFDFFGDGSKYSWGINPDYWAQKLTMTEQLREGGEVYSPEAFWAAILEWTRVRLEEYGWDEEIYPSLLVGALEREMRVEHWYAEPQLPSDEDEARELVDKYFWLFNEQEWNFRDFDTHYLRACWAIVWAIKQYGLAVGSDELAATSFLTTREAA